MNFAVPVCGKSFVGKSAKSGVRNLCFRRVLFVGVAILFEERIDYMIRCKSTFLLPAQTERRWESAFSEKSQTESQNANYEVGDFVFVLQAAIDTLQGQLQVKDKQIEQLTF